MSWDINGLEEHLLVGSTLVEGSTLTEGEAREILQGRTVMGHHITEIRELLNYRSAIQWFAAQIEQSPYVSADMILEFHRRLFQGLPGTYGRLKAQANFTYLTDGTRHEYIKPSRVSAALTQWLAQFNETEDSPSASHAAAKLYYEFQNIHPFEDGNGRVGRILIAYWLHWKHRARFSFYAKDKVEHLQALEASNHDQPETLAKFFLDRLSSEEE